MRIIKEGNPPHREIFHGTCTHCKTEMEEIKSKLNKLTFLAGDRPGEKSTAIGKVTCPVCTQEATLYATGKFHFKDVLEADNVMFS